MAFFKNLWTFLTETIFLKDERNYRNGLIRWGVRQYKLLFYTARGLDEHDTLVRSAALTFYTLMSIVPIAALVFAVVKGFGLADGLMQNLYSLFPHNREVVDYLITFADKALAALITAALQGGDASAYAAEVASVTDALKSELAGELKAGLELRLSKKVRTGFRLCAKDGSGYIDCSDEELAEQLAPFFRELRI